jgi:multisubunit Na+/H+ antiporter MnhE subunit
VSKYVPIDDILEDYLVSFYLFLRISFELLDFVLGFRVAVLCLKLVQQILEFSYLALD